MIPRRRYNMEPRFLGDLAAGMPAGKGRAVADFEKSFADYLGGSNLYSVRATASGRAALAILLDRLGVPAGSTVMLPAYTLGAMGPFLERQGYRWITCDVDENLPLMTGASVAAAWPGDGSVRCVLATHLFGIPADVPSIARFAHRHGAVVIEDCAQSAGSRLDGKMTGTMGDGALFSYNYLKPVNCFGGGAAVMPGKVDFPALPPQPRTEVAALFAGGVSEDLIFAGPWLRIPTAMLAFDGLAPIATAVDTMIRRPAGQAFDLQSMSRLQALHGLRSLATVERRIEARRAAAATICALAGLDDSMWLPGGATRANAYFLTVRVADAGSFRRDLWLKGVDAGYGTEVADYLDCPGSPERHCARRWFEQAVQIPCHESLSRREIERIGRVVGRLLRKYA